MSKSLLYCEDCGRFVETDIQQRCETLRVKGIDITLDVDSCVCKSCGKPVFSPDVDDNSMKQFYREYRRITGLLQPEEIHAIRDQYGMSQESFARVLGMGAKTISRYENGSLQDEAQNNLILLMRDRKNMRILMEQHPERLPFSMNFETWHDAAEYMTSVSMQETNTPVIDFTRFKIMKERGNGYADDVYSTSLDILQA